METCGQNILLQSAHLNFHVLVAHGNQQAGSLWINSRGDQLWKLGGAHSHQHPHLHCRKVTSTDNHLVSQRGHDGAEHIFTSFSSATQFQEQVRQVLIANVEEASVLNQRKDPPTQMFLLLSLLLLPQLATSIIFCSNKALPFCSNLADY